jgi:hypothetical protein
MKSAIAVLLGVLTTASMASSQSAAPSDLPSIAVLKTTAVLVIETPKQGVSFQQVMAVIPLEVRATVIVRQNPFCAWRQRA